MRKKGAAGAKKPDRILHPDYTESAGFAIACDVTRLAEYCRGYYEGLGLSVDINYPRLWSVVTMLETIVTQNASTETPSLFKRSAALTIAFIHVSPLEKSFAGAKIDETLLSYRNHQNAIIPFEYCRHGLHTAQITPSDGKVRNLTNRIVVSTHSYRDIIHAISTLSNTPPCFHFLSLLYESLVYRANPTASDDLIV